MEQQNNWPGTYAPAFISRDPDDKGGGGKPGRINPTQKPDWWGHSSEGAWSNVPICIPNSKTNCTFTGPISATQIRVFFFSFSSLLLKTHLQVVPTNILRPSFIHCNCDLR